MFAISYAGDFRLGGSINYADKRERSELITLSDTQTATQRQLHTPGKLLCRQQPAEPGRTTSSQSEEHARRSLWSNDENPEIKRHKEGSCLILLTKIS